MRLATVAAIAALALCGCHAIKPPVSAATLRAGDLPADLAALRQLATEQFRPTESVALENTLVVCDRILALVPGDYDAGWQWARAAFWLADGAGAEKDRRAWFSEQGAARAQRAIRSDPGRVEGHYYRGLDLGYLASTRTIGALELVKDIYAEAQAAVAADEKYDHAGPLRLLGGVLIHAPGWPTSVGDPDEGSERLARAVELAPEYPLNHLYFGEGLLRNDKHAEAEKELVEAERLLSLPEHAWMKARVQPEIDEQLARARKR